MIVRIVYENWIAKLNIYNYLESFLNDDNINKISHVYFNKRDSILFAKASIIDQFQQVQEFKKLWLFERVLTKLKIRDCLNIIAVTIVNNSRISQFFSRILLYYDWQNELREFLLHDRKRKIKFLHMNIDHLKNIYELFCFLLKIDEMHSKFLSTIQLTDERVFKIMKRYRKWESENSRLF